MFSMMTSRLKSVTSATNRQSGQPQILEKVEIHEAKAQHVGLLVNEELEKAIQRCREKVERISKECRARNVRFRDSEFDCLEDDERCLHALDTEPGDKTNPEEALRVTQIFDKPQFFIDGASAGDIVQGGLGDCWFVCALATVSSLPGLIEKICVARDEEVGVYGFIFYRDAGWVDVIIDDLLFVSIPRWESLTSKEQSLYQNQKRKYDAIGRRGSKTLFFAKSGTENETWVPLIEKAYAKLHGDYGSLNGGYPSEAVEDMTGAVASMFMASDILDPDRFWKEELLFANQDRLFGCNIFPVTPTWDGNSNMIEGIYTSHAYSILKAVDFNGKRFLVVRNPHGQTEWTGRWSDGSKEWTEEWLPALKALGHTFGNDGAFVMEYEDFLSVFSMIQRARLFDETWRLSSHWLRVFVHPLPAARAFGDVSFTFTLEKASLTVLALSKIDTRYYHAVAGSWNWSVEFALYKKGDTVPTGRSVHSGFWTRSVTLELQLEPGDYVVHVRLDRDTFRDVNFRTLNEPDWNKRKLADTLAEAAKTESIAANFDEKKYANLLRLPLDAYAGKDLQELELSTEKPKVTPAPPATNGTTTTTTVTTETKETVTVTVEAPTGGTANGTLTPAATPTAAMDAPKDGAAVVHEDVSCDACKVSPVTGTRYKCLSPDCPDFDLCSACMEKGEHNKDHMFARLDVPAKEGQFDKFTAKPEEAPKADEPPKEPEVVHAGVSCNECKTDAITGPRYKCIDARCPDYDLCSKCMEKGVHPKDHRFLRIDTPEQDAALNNTNPNSAEEEEVTVGLRVYTQNTVTKLSGQLRHGRVLSWKNPKAVVSTPAAPVATT